MTPSAQNRLLFPSLPVVLGGYRLTHLLGSHSGSELYIARQSHVERRVVLEIMRPTSGEDTTQAAAYLRLARARATARLPHVSPVLESSSSPEGYCFISQSLPEGMPLSTMAAEGSQLTVPQVCSLIQKAAELYRACAQAGLAAAPLTADRIFMTRAGEFSFLSPVQEGEPAEEHAALQQQGLATTLRPVQPVNVPGQGRIATLLTWMQDGYEGTPLDWASAAHTAELIAAQLKPTPMLHVDHPQRYDKGREERAGKRRRRLGRRRCLFITSAVLTICAMGAAGAYMAPDTVPPHPALRGNYVHCKAGNKTQRVAARPVSIAEYRRYLEAYPSLDASRRGSLTQNIPPTESDPTPADWDAQLAAAHPDAPVTNISYWQALMYVRCQRATLPTATLLATARAEAGQPGVEEWTHDELPPTLPYSAARVVLPAEGNTSPLPENNPSARTSRRGFRLCR